MVEKDNVNFTDKSGYGKCPNLTHSGQYSYEPMDSKLYWNGRYKGLLRTYVHLAKVVLDDDGNISYKPYNSLPFYNKKFQNFMKEDQYQKARDLLEKHLNTYYQAKQ